MVKQKWNNNNRKREEQELEIMGGQIRAYVELGASLAVTITAKRNQKIH
jgi:hypothetical protein